ncbi:reverse transcriptase [Tanacetum coccineum]
MRWTSWESMCISKFRGGMGFCHMNGFNKALLAKQGWRLITMEESLPARILKARYFPRSCFLEASIGHKPSFIWRSLCSARDIIRKGQKWNVGNGMQVRIWEDYWVEGYTTLHNHAHNHDLHVVNDLLDPTTERWNHTLLLQVFPRQIADKISCIHINPAECDSRYWNASPNGMFTCKSAYWIATQNLDCFQESQSQSERKVLKAMWLANLPNKVKVFIWRACMNLMPSMSNLVARGLAHGSLTCVHCSAPSEDIKHALFLCDWARDIWASMELADLTNLVVNISIEEMLCLTLEQQKGKFELMLMLMWRIWGARNSKAHGQRELDQNEVKESAHVMLQDFSRANQTTTDIMAPRNAPSQAWSPPSYGEIKINGDAGVGNDGVAGLGFVIRSHSGAVLVAGSRCVKFATSVVEAEAKACLWAVEVALAKGFTRVVLESDSSVLVEAFKHDKVLVHIRALFLHIHRLCLSFESCSWSFVRREGNRVAHELARIALNDSIDGFYDGFVPPSVEPWVEHDVNCQTRL